MEIYDIKINHLKNPVGYKMDRVTLSWKIKNAKGKKQESAKVLVALDSELKEIIFDSGYVSDASSLAWDLKLDLKPRTRYYYSLFVKSDIGEEAESDIQYFETGKMDEPWSGSWISCDSNEKRHPIFGKKIDISKEVSEARLYICGLGLYEAYFDGERIGDEYLTPYSNDYNRWIQYQTYDVTDQINKSGILSILMGNGWYKSRFGFLAMEDKGFYGSEWKLIAELHLKYQDGSREVVGTDESWQVRRSNITFSNLYDGESVDETLPELPLENADICQAPKGELTARLSSPVTIHEEIEPVELIHTPKGELVIDMGQEFAGSFRLKVDLPKGALVHIQTGEILQQGNFYNENLRSAKSEYFYISNGRPAIIQPHFTYFGYRYVKIEGVDNLKTSDFTGLAYYSQIDQMGFIRTGHDLVNKLISNVRWGMKSNFIDVPSDCPQRDERMGWTGDTQVFSPTATYLADTYAFYKKYLYDLYQEQQDTDGKVPDVIPSCGVETTACVWGDVACILPWNLYIFYGDKAILEDQYPSMKAWVEYIRKVDENTHEWGNKFHYGDWLALDNMSDDPEQCMGATDVDYIANIYYANSARILSDTARILGKKEEQREYKILEEQITDYIKKEYFSPNGRCCIKTQTALLLALKYDLSSNRELIKEQLRRLFLDSNFKLKTGFVGTPLLCNILTVNGMESLAFKLLLNEEYPGWLREIKLGATTVWERWNSLYDDGTISGTGMNSMNHYAYGSILEWMFRYVAGLDVDEKNPGCKHIDLKPTLNWDLKQLEARYDSPSGEYLLSWEIIDQTHVKVSAKVPFDCTASLSLPMTSYEQPIMLEAGEYSYEYVTDKSIKPVYNTRDYSVRELLSKKEIAESLPILKRVPNQYLNNTLEEMPVVFPGIIDEKMLPELDRALAEF